MLSTISHTLCLKFKKCVLFYRNILFCSIILLFLSVSLLDDFFLVTDWTHNTIYQVSLVNNEIRAVDTETYGRPVGIEYNYVTRNLIWNSEFIAHQINIKTGDYKILLNTGNCSDFS